MALFNLAVGGLLVLACVGYYLFHKPPFHPKAPPLVTDATPLIGSISFFQERWFFWQRATSRSNTGNFTFWAGQHPVVGMSGAEGRKIFLDDKRLNFAEGYGALLAGSVTPSKDGTNEGENKFAAYITRRLTELLRGPHLQTCLPHLLSDTRTRFDELVADPSGMMNPFESIYGLVFHLTMRTVASNEIADDRASLARCLKLFEELDKSSTAVQVMYPWLPLPSKLKRLYAGGQLYMLVKNVADARQKAGKRDEDALQFLLDQGDDMTNIISFIIGALFAGLLNSGIAGSWILCYLATHRDWLQQVREEVESVANRYCADTDMPLKERLMKLPIEAWETGFPIVDLCLKETIRLQLHGTMFRRNHSNQDITINRKTGEIIPAGNYAAFHVGDVHFNPDVFSNPDEWDPSRYTAAKAEDKKETYAFIGWGAGRHPCLGKRFAQLENNMIVAFFVAYFSDFQLVDKSGNPTSQLAATDRNAYSACKPADPMFLQYVVA